MSVVVVLSILKAAFVYWEFDFSDGLLCERRFWAKRIVERDAILRVSGSTYWRMKPTVLKIEFARTEASFKTRRVFADPAKMQEFISALRQFAPEAAFDI